MLRKKCPTWCRCGYYYVMLGCRTIDIGEALSNIYGRSEMFLGQHYQGSQHTKASSILDVWATLQCII